jgi:hypothetical protein
MYRGELRERLLNGRASEIRQRSDEEDHFSRCELREVTASLEDGEAATSRYGHLRISEND